MTFMRLLGASESLDAGTRHRLSARSGVSFDGGLPSSPAELKAFLRAHPTDLLITNSEVLDLLPLGQPWIEWGYPSYYTHFFHDEPFLGFSGCGAFLSRMANAISKQFAGPELPTRGAPLDLPRP
jgi:nitrogenase molybdenum-iron protein alpha/beta subunit